MVPDVVPAGFSDLFAITNLDGTPDPLSAAAGTGILAIVALALIALVIWVWSRV